MQSVEKHEIQLLNAHRADKHTLNFIDIAKSVNISTLMPHFNDLWAISSAQMHPKPMLSFRRFFLMHFCDFLLTFSSTRILPYHSSSKISNFKKLDFSVEK